MAKIRLKFENFYIWHGRKINTEIICKHIQIITIDNITYYKKDFIGDSIKTQKFYKNIINNKEKITYIKVYKKENVFNEFYIKNNKLHCIVKPAKCHVDGDSISFEEYFINGRHLGKQHWLIDTERIQLLRELKLKRIRQKK